MKSKTINLLSNLSAFSMIVGGIVALYKEDYLYVGIGIYFIAKGLFVYSLMQKMQEKRNCEEKN